MSQLTTVDSLTGDDVHNLKKEKGPFVRDRILKSVCKDDTKDILGYQFTNYPLTDLFRVVQLRRELEKMCPLKD